MKKGLTTHVLDLTNGIPASNLKVELWSMSENVSNKRLLATAITDDQGRIDTGLLTEIEKGEYELVFHAGLYYQTIDTPLGDPIFFNNIPIRFHLSDNIAHYHIPLLISPWGYQTYRGC
jgi:5-hydroxyisourate hydrolase